MVEVTPEQEQKLEGDFKVLRKIVNENHDSYLRLFGEWFAEKSHPCNQMAFMVLVQEFVRAMTEKQFVDVRNQEAHEVCKRLQAVLQETKVTRSC